MNLRDASRMGPKRKAPKRVGRGGGSGRGNRSGRGQKGSRSRSGSHRRYFHEGGQMPLYRRLPKRGFTNARFRVRYDFVNLADLNRFDDGSEVSLDRLREAGVIRPRYGRLKVLGRGPLERRLTVLADRFTEGARAEIERLGGEARTVGEKAKTS